jgi:hypothetical protein
MDFAASVAPWAGFFTTAAGASAVLLGLVFVAMSIHYNLAAFDRHLVAMVTESAVPFFYATLVSLVMLVPPTQPWVPTAALFVVGGLASLNSGVPLFGRYFNVGPGADASPGADARPGADASLGAEPGSSGRQPLAPVHHRPLSFVLPFFAALALLPTAIALLTWPAEALYVVGFLVLAFVAFGMQNAWDALLRRDLRGTPVPRAAQADTQADARAAVPAAPTLPPGVPAPPIPPPAVDFPSDSRSQS